MRSGAPLGWLSTEGGTLPHLEPNDSLINF